MSKFRMYIDEVGNSDLGSSDNPNHRFLSLTGVIIALDFVGNALHPEMENLKVRHFGSHPDDPVIFHQKELVNCRFPLAHLIAHPSRAEILDENGIPGRPLAPFSKRVIDILQEKYDQRGGTVYGKKFL